MQTWACASLKATPVYKADVPLTLLAQTCYVPNERVSVSASICMARHLECFNLTTQKLCVICVC